MTSLLRTFRSMTRISKVALAGILISSFGTFMFMPYISIYLSDLNYSPSFIGIILLLFSISQQGFTFFGGFLTDQFGTKNVCLSGLIIRSIGYVLFILSINKQLIIVSTIFVGLGGAMITPSLKVLLAYGNDSIRSSVFALRNTAVNIGAALGPLVGGILYLVSIRYIFVFSAATHIIVMVLVKKLLIQKIGNESSTIPVSSMFAIFKDKRIVYLTFAVSFFYFLYMQFNLTIPLYMKDFLKKPEYVSMIFSFNGFLTILLQYPIMVYFQNRFKEHSVLVIGMIFVAFGFVTLTLSDHLAVLFVFTFLLTIGEILIPASLDNIASQLAPKRLLGSYLGFVVFSFMIGGGLGSLTGGFCYKWGLNNGMIWLWFIYIGVALVGLILLWKVKVILNHTNRSELHESSSAN